MNRKEKLYKILRTIVYSIFVILFISPIFIMISSSLKTYSEITMWPPSFFGKTIEWNNYILVLTGEKNIVTPIINSLVISITTSILCIVIGVLAAYAANRYEFKFRKIFLVLIITTQMFATVILVNPMYLIFNNLGILDTRLCLIIANTATALPMTVWLLFSYINSIPKELEEAAWMDGCSRLKGIYHVIIPQLLPGIITTALFDFIISWGDLIFAKAFIISPEMRTISLALTDFQSIYKTSWETQMAASVISVIPTIIIFIFIQKRLIKGLTSSGIKG